jgi:hypothetical protein
MFETLISKTAEQLERAGLPYMIIGGQAVLLYGTPRMTKDIDITLGVDTKRLDLVVQTVNTIGLEIIPEDFGAFVEKTYVLPTMEKESGIRIDFIFSFTPYERQAIARATPALLGRTKVMFASVEDVIIHKVFAGRPRDMEDVRSMMIKNPGVDRGYVRKWLKEFEQSPEKGGLLKGFEDILIGLRA